MEQQAQQPIQEKTESKHPIKTNWKFITIVVVLGLVVGGGIWWHTNSLRMEPQTPQIVTPRPTPSPTPSKVDVSTWQTYRNDDFGFEVRYPKDWQLAESRIKQSFKIPFVPEVYATEPLNFYQIPTIFSIELRDPKNKVDHDLRRVTSSIVISVKYPKDTPLFYEVVKDIESYERVMKKYFREGRIVSKGTLAGKPALYSRRNVGTGNESIEYLAYDGYDEEVDVFLDGRLYVIYRNGAYYEPYFDQILSTFRFVGKDQGVKPLYETISVDWEEALNVLRSGQVTHVFQAHDLSVHFTLKDGTTTVVTKQPRIDIIYDEIKKCGEICKDTVIETE